MYLHINMIRFDYYYRGEVKSKKATIESILKDIRSCKYSKQVEELRKNIACLIVHDQKERMGSVDSKLPTLYWAEGENGYTGLVVVSDTSVTRRYHKNTHVSLHKPLYYSALTTE